MFTFAKTRRLGWMGTLVCGTVALGCQEDSDRASTSEPDADVPRDVFSEVALDSDRDVTLLDDVVASQTRQDGASDIDSREDSESPPDVLADSGGNATEGGNATDGGNQTATAAIYPTQRPFASELLDLVKVPVGFSIRVFARNVGNARMLETTPDGTVYVTRPQTGDVLMLRDKDGDGEAETSTVVASGLQMPHGIVFKDGKLYLAMEKDVRVATVAADGTLGPLTMLTEQLPDGGQHPRRTLGFAPDGQLFISVGSSCNACNEPNLEHATMLRMAPNPGAPRSTYARGLRNTLGFDWHPVTKALWGMDQGSDDRGNDAPPEELNQLVSGNDYGWPYAYAKRQVDPKIDNPPGGTKEQYAATTEPSVLEYQAHSSPIAFRFYTGSMFPAEYKNDAFIAMRGSWNRVPAVGYKIVRVRFVDGRPSAFEDFATGWLIENGQAHFGRLAGLVVAPDGALLISDDANGIVYRVTYSR